MNKKLVWDNFSTYYYTFKSENEKEEKEEK